MFLSDPILDVAVLKSNHEEAERKLCSPCNHFYRAYQQGLASDTHSKRGASAPRGDRMNAEAEDLLVPVFMVFDPVQEACLEPVSNWFATSCTRLFGFVDALRLTLTAASHYARLC